MELIVFLIICVVVFLLTCAITIAGWAIMAALVAIALMIILIGYIIKKIQEHERKMSDTQFYTVISLSILGILVISSVCVTYYVGF